MEHVTSTASNMATFIAGALLLFGLITILIGGLQLLFRKPNGGAVLNSGALVVFIAIILAGVANINWNPMPPAVPATQPSSRPVLVTITSDPAGATVYLRESRIGETPITIAVPKNTPTSYRVVAESNVPNHELYHRFSGMLIVSEPQNVSVWLNRLNDAEVAELMRRREAERRQACLHEAERIPLVIDNWTWKRTAGDRFSLVEGRVTNRSARPLRSILAVVEFETAQGQFITSDWSFVDFNPLMPGQSSPFQIYATWNPAKGGARLSFREFGGQRIESVRKQDACQL